MNDDLYGTRPRRGITGPLIAVLLAFVLGIALTAFAVRRWDQVAGWIRPASVKPVAALVPAPVVKPVIVPAAPAPAPGAESELADRVDTLETRMDRVDQRASEANGDVDRAEAMLTAFAARRALDRGQPLGYLEGLLRQHFGSTDAASVALIIASAQRPVTLNQLQDAFDELRPALATAAPNESWWTGVKREMGSLFVVRHAATPSSVPSDRLARADHALAQGEVDVAAAEVARLPGSARASGWLASARRYILARGALDKIETASLLKSPAPNPLAAPSD